MSEAISMRRLVKLQLVVHVDRGTGDDPEHQVVPWEKVPVEEPFERQGDLARGRQVNEAVIEL
jgi:hypothetical protein